MGKGVDLICRLEFTNGQHNYLNSSWNTGPGQESPFVIYCDDQIELDNNKIVGKKSYIQDSLYKESISEAYKFNKQTKNDKLKSLRT